MLLANEGLEIFPIAQEKFEMLVEPAEDTKVLLCWNSDTVHLSFRGTASMTNVLADLQVKFLLTLPKVNLMISLQGCGPTRGWGPLPCSRG